VIRGTPPGRPPYGGATCPVCSLFLTPALGARDVRAGGRPPADSCADTDRYAADVPSDFPYGPDSALLVVDVQNDFADPAGSLYVTGGEAVVPVVNSEIAAAGAAGARITYTADWHPSETAHFTTGGGIWPVHCVAGTWGAAFHPDLDLAGEVIRKGTAGEDGYSGFTLRDPVTGSERRTPLGAVLHAAGVRRVVVVGLATDYCVKATALDAAAAGFATTVLTGAVAAVDLQPGDGDQALAQMSAAGVTVV
jgi:nicotinamidase/pyrazinamidase